MIRSFGAALLGWALLGGCFDGGASSGSGDFAVASRAPAEGAAGVPLEAAIVATFSERIDPKSVTPATFTVSVGGVPLAGSVSVSESVAVFSPASRLSPRTTYKVTLSADIHSAGGAELGAAISWSFTTGAPADGTAPQIVDVQPAAQSADVPIDTLIQVTFSESIDERSVTPANFSVVEGSTAVAGALSYAGSAITFAPEAPLALDRVYTVSVSGAIVDRAGNPLAGGLVFSFRTERARDRSPPTVESTIPGNDAAGVAPDAAVHVVFSEEMAPETINAATVSVSRAEMPVAGTVLYAGRTAVFVPLAPWTLGGVYTVRVSTAATDLAGNRLALPHQFRFTAGNPRDTTPFAVASMTPSAGASEIPHNIVVRAVFNRDVLPETVNVGTVLLSWGGIPVPGTVGVGGTSVVFSPSAPLEPRTTYTVTITRAVSDLYGELLPRDHNWTFTTRALPDATKPVVVSTSPARDEASAPLTPTITATFSEDIASATVNLSTFAVTTGGVAIAGTVSQTGATARFSPAVALQPEVRYTATLAASIADLAGNTMGQPYTWSFTTGPVPDFTAPNVSATSPARSATDVPVETAITLTFSEPVNPTSINPTTVRLSRDQNPIAVSIYAAGRTAVIAPTTPLEFATTYTVLVTTGVADLAGNPLPDIYSFTFTTANRPDRTPPFVSSTSPTPGQSGVPTSSVVRATFSEAIDPVSVSAANFLLSIDNVQVAGSVAVAGATAVFSPTTPLVASTRYTATLLPGVRDLSGNSTTSNYSWTFVTGSP
jgi:methionine-rich copper-binding protein CopC